MAQVITIGELLLRLTPPNKRRITQANEFNIYYGGAEANVAISLSKYGHDVSFMSVLPPNSLGDAAVLKLQEANVDTTYIYRIGERLGTYYFEEGFSLRQAKVVYDRNHSSFLQLPKNEVDWESVFKDKSLLHITGITPALSDEMKTFTLDAVQEAKKQGIQVSFDFNYRSKLWSIEEARDTFLDILPYVDICFAGHKDLYTFLEYKELKYFDKDLVEKYYRKMAEIYDIKYIASTYRNVISSSENELKGFIYSDGNFQESDSISFEILDRIGGGDAFASGVLHGILTNMNLETTIEFGVASSVLKHFVYGDNAQFTIDEVNDFINDMGDGDVSR